MSYFSYCSQGKSLFREENECRVFLSELPLSVFEVSWGKKSIVRPKISKIPCFPKLGSVNTRISLLACRSFFLLSVLT